MEQKISKKSIIIIAVVSLVLLVGLIFGAKILADKQEQKKAETIKAEYTERIDAKIDAYLSRSFEDQSYEQREFGIEDVSVEVKDIVCEKESNLYIIHVAAYVQTRTTALDDTDRSLISHDIKNGVLRLAEKNGLSGKFTVAGYKCCYQPSGSIDGNTVSLYDEQITVYINEQTGHVPETTTVELDDDKDAVKCQVCGNKYKKGSDNAKSINRTNMCSSCYKNYKTLSDAMDEMPVD